MKRVFVILILTFAAYMGYAQRSIVIDTEKIFKSQNDYNAAVSAIERLSEQYQQRVDDQFAAIESMYNDYQRVRANLSEAQRRQREDAIINREREATRFQQDAFGPEGDLMKQRVDLLKPVQDRVFGVIDRYARDNGIDLVIDSASNPAYIYISDSIDKTDEIINLLK
jgi:outer membrane protein